jgi:hypothetical protein
MLGILTLDLLEEFEKKNPNMDVGIAPCKHSNVGWVLNLDLVMKPTYKLTIDFLDIWLN